MDPEEYAWEYKLQQTVRDLVEEGLISNHMGVLEEVKTIIRRNLKCSD